jgi:hypothetical protein
MCLYLSFGCRLDDALLTHWTDEFTVATIVPHPDERGSRSDAIGAFWAKRNGNDKLKEYILEPTNRLGQKDRLYEIAEPIFSSGVAKKCVDA